MKNTQMSVMPGIETPQKRATYALAQARKHRHHEDCRCRMFQRNYCNAADALWQNAMNRELDLIPRPEDRKTC